MRLADVTWTDVADGEYDCALLPVGSTEQHGPHAPLGVDTRSARAIATAGAERYARRRSGDAGTGEDTHDGEAGDGGETAGDDPDVTGPPVAPTLPVGVAEEHRQFPGTLWVSEDTFRAYVRETAASLADVADVVVVVNGHGGNTAALREVCGRLTRDGTCYAVSYTWFDAVDVEAVAPDQPLGHAGAVETSLLCHLAPELIHPERFSAAAAGAGEAFGEFVAGTNLAYDFAEFAPSGNVGDPTSATAAAGKALLEAAADRLAEVLVAAVDRDRDATRQWSLDAGDDGQPTE